jgi:hypothetical protein
VLDQATAQGDGVSILIPVHPQETRSTHDESKRRSSCSAVETMLSSWFRFVCLLLSHPLVNYTELYSANMEVILMVSVFVAAVTVTTADAIKLYSVVDYNSNRPTVAITVSTSYSLLSRCAVN